MGKLAVLPAQASGQAQEHETSTSNPINSGRPADSQPAPTLSSATTPAQHTDKDKRVGGKEDATTPATRLEPRCLRREEIWREMVLARGNKVKEHFPTFHYMVVLACHPAVITVGVLAALWTTVSELWVAFLVMARGDYNVGFISGGSGFALLVAVLIIPYCIKGGMTTKLIQNKSDSKSYYEVLDVLLRDIDGNTYYVEKGSVCSAGNSSGSRDASEKITRRGSVEVVLQAAKVLVSVPVDKVGENRRERCVKKIKNSMCVVYVVAVAIVLASSAYGAYCVYYNVQLLRGVYEAKHFYYFRARLALCSLPQFFMYTVASLELTTALMVIWLASGLHRAQTQLFVKYVKPFRVPDEQSMVQAAEEGRQADEGFEVHQFRRVMEAYLLMQYCFDKSSDCWGVGLSIWILSTGGLFLLSLLAYVVTPDPELQVQCLIIGAANFLVCILPIFMLAYANGFVDHILRAFQRAAFDDHDFKRIGGRDRWMEFIKGNPAYWCIFGFAITRSWLMGFVTGSVSAFALIGLDKLAGIS